MKKKKVDNNSKFLFMMSGFSVILLTMIFISTNVSRVTYSVDADESGLSSNCVNYFEGEGKCCSSKNSGASATSYESEQAALDACNTRKRNNASNNIYTECSGTYSKTMYSNPNSTSYFSTWEEAYVDCTSHGYSNCTYSSKNFYGFKYTDYSNCSDRYTCKCVNQSSSGCTSYKMFDKKENSYIGNNIPDERSCTYAITNNLYANENCGFTVGEEKYYYLGVVEYYDSTEKVGRDYCYGNGSHCKKTAPEHNCSEGDTFVGWVDDEASCAADANAIKPGEYVFIYLAGYMQCGETKTIKKYACCASGSSSSKPSSSNPSSSKPSSVKSSSVKKSDPLPPENPDTGSKVMYLISALSVIMAGYSVWYFKKND